MKIEKKQIENALSTVKVPEGDKSIWKSGVVKNIPDNSKVMGYPAKDIRSFLKENK